MIWLPALLFIIVCWLLLPKPLYAWEGVLLEDDFRFDANKWEVIGGDWDVVDGEYVSGGGFGISVVDDEKWDNYAYEVRMKTDESGDETWAAGMVIFRHTEESGDHYFVLLHTNRMLELGKQQGGRHIPKLKTVHGVADPRKWNSIKVEVKGARIKVYVNGREWIDYTDKNPIDEGVVGFRDNHSRGCRYDDILVMGQRKKVAAVAKDIKIEEGKEGNIAILRDKLPGLDLSVIDHIADELRSAGFGVTFISGNEASKPNILNSDNFFLYIIPNARIYPSVATDALRSYAHYGGNLMVLGGPAFKDPVWMHEGEWMTYDALLANVKPEHIFLDFEDINDLAGWVRYTNEPNVKASMEVVKPGANNTRGCMKVEVANLTGWNTYSSPQMDDMFPSGETLLCFWAKGNERTPQLAIEINESDGSRWIAVVELTTEWKHYVLSPKDFPYWYDSPTSDKRGMPGDWFRPEEAVKINFGLALGHTVVTGEGPYTFWVDEVGSTLNPFTELKVEKTGTPLVFETIAPSYKVYHLPEIASLEIDSNQVIIDRKIAPHWSLSSGISPVRRSRGQGFGNRRKWRWIPLINALDKNMEERGTIAWMLIKDGDVVFSSFGFNDQSLFKEETWSSILVEVVGRVKDGIFLYEAGSRYFSYWPDEKVKLGAEVLNLGGKNVPVTVRIQITPAGQTDIVFEDEINVLLRLELRRTRAEFEWSPEKFDYDLYMVKTELLKGGEVVDMISHEMGILSTKRPLPDEFVTVRDGDFYLRGEKWYPVGINYWPLSDAGLEIVDLRTGWLDPRFYDPEVVERDLQKMRALGINTVSIQMGGPSAARTLLDFLRRCERYNIKVHAYLGGGAYPGDIIMVEDHFALMKELIQKARLADNPTIFAFDFIWEPANWMFAAPGRERWDRYWEEWIIERYGSIENAEDDCGHPVPRKEGKVTSPSDRQMREDGE